MRAEDILRLWPPGGRKLWSRSSTDIRPTVSMVDNGLLIRDVLEVSLGIDTGLVLLDQEQRGAQVVLEGDGEVLVQPGLHSHDPRPGTTLVQRLESCLHPTPPLQDLPRH